MGSPRQEYWGGLLFPTPGDYLDSGIEQASPALQVNSLPLSHQGSLPHRLTLLQSNQPLGLSTHTLGPCPQSKDLSTGSSSTQKTFSLKIYLVIPWLKSCISLAQISYSLGGLPCQSTSYYKLPSVRTAFISFSVLAPLCLHFFLILLKDILCISVQECQPHNGSRLSFY